jgi:hypothetical protein
MAMVIKVKQLEVGEEFTTSDSQGETWFRVSAIEKVRARPWLINVRGVVVSANPDSPYSVGEEEWFDFDGDFGEIITR